MTCGILRDGVLIRHMPSQLTPAQISTYIETIKKYGDFPGDGYQDAFQPNLESLSTLMVLHTLAFPMENTDMH